MGRGSTFLANSSKALGISYQLVAAVAVVSAMGERFHSRPAAIGPSVLAADMSRLMEESVDVERHGADYIHLDVMDGHFVPNLTFGAPVIKGLRKHTKALLDAHLMVTNPAQWVDDMAEAGVDRLTFHVEATDKVSEVMAQVKAKGMGVGLALKPGTPVEDVFPYCEELDLVLVMTVEPGFGGQSFMADQMAKVRELRRRYPNLDIEVDGGLADDTIEEAARAGANLIVCGSYIFKGNRAERINFLKRAVASVLEFVANELLWSCVCVWFFIECKREEPDSGTVVLYVCAIRSFSSQSQREGERGREKWRACFSEGYGGGIEACRRDRNRHMDMETGGYRSCTELGPFATWSGRRLGFGMGRTRSEIDVDWGQYAGVRTNRDMAGAQILSETPALVFENFVFFSCLYSVPGPVLLTSSLSPCTLGDMIAFHLWFC
ncbi:unnamed protein product [Pylaiella littoralis]